MPPCYSALELKQEFLPADFLATKLRHERRTAMPHALFQTHGIRMGIQQAFLRFVKLSKSFFRTRLRGHSATVFGGEH